VRSKSLYIIILLNAFVSSDRQTRSRRVASSGITKSDFDRLYYSVGIWYNIIKYARAGGAMQYNRPDKN